MNDPPPSRRRANPLPAVAIALAMLILLPLIISRLTTPDAADVRAAADATARELERTPVRGLGIYIFDVEQALADATQSRRGNMSDEVKVTDKGHDSRGDLYEFTTDDGDHPVCLAVQIAIDLTGNQPAFPTTDVTDGPCQT